MIDLLSSLPGAVAQGLIWGIMAVGVYITYKLLDIADLTVDGSICTGAAVCTMMLLTRPEPVAGGAVRRGGGPAGRGRDGPACISGWASPPFWQAS